MGVTNNLQIVRNIISSWTSSYVLSLLHVDIHWQHLVYLDEISLRLNNYVFFGAKLELSFYRTKNGYRVTRVH